MVRVLVLCGFMALKCTAKSIRNHFGVNFWNAFKLAQLRVRRKTKQSKKRMKGHYRTINEEKCWTKKFLKSILEEIAACKTLQT